jgi:tripartite-type tricarboxylate transporter receptor subunit TctC
MIAADFVLKQPADGYTLLWANPDLLLKFAKEGSQIRFTKEDFIPIGTYVESPFVMTVSKEKSPFMKFEDLVDYARKNPGKVSYPSSGIGTTPHLINEVLQEQLGIKLNHIPFSGGAPSLAAMLGGHVDYHIGVRVTFGDHIKPGGSGRPLAVTSRERWPEFPDVPTLIEKGCNLEYTYWCFLWAPKGTPQPVLDILEKGLKKAADDPQFKELCGKAYYRSLNIGPEGTKKKIDKEFEFFSGLCNRLGLK